MMNAAFMLNDYGHWLATHLGRMSIELAILACIVLVALYALRVKSPAVRHLFLGLLLAKPVATLLLASPLSLYAVLWPPAPPVAPVQTAVVQYAPHVEVSTTNGMSEKQIPLHAPAAPPAVPVWWRQLNGYGAFSLLWTAIAGLLGVRLLLGCAYVTFLRSTSVEQHSGVLPDAVALASGALGMRRRVRVATTAVAHGPVLAGIFRPLILFPESVVASLTPEQLKLVVTHELAHARRWDNLVLLIQRLAEMFLFFHPVVWLCGWMMRREAEAACDDAVVSAYNDEDAAVAYADSLTRVAEMRCGITRRLLVNTFAAAESNFAGRIRRILGGRKRQVTFALSAATGAALLLIGLLGLPTATSLTKSEKDDGAASLREMLEKPGSIAFNSVHLNDILTFIATSNDGLNFAVDWRVVSMPGAQPSRADSLARGAKSERVTDGLVPYIDIRNCAWREVLIALLKPLGLAFDVKDHYLWISTPERIAAENASSTVDATGASKWLRNKLAAPISVTFEDIQIRDILAFLQDDTKISFDVDAAVVPPLPPAQPDASSVATLATNGFVPYFEVREAPLSAVLEALLRPLNLRATADRKRIRISENPDVAGMERYAEVSESKETVDPSLSAEKIAAVEGISPFVQLSIRGMHVWARSGDSFGGYFVKELTAAPPAVSLTRQEDGAAVQLVPLQGVVMSKPEESPGTSGYRLVNIQGEAPNCLAQIQHGNPAGKYWYSVGMFFEDCVLANIDPVAKTATLITEDGAKSIVLRVGEPVSNAPARPAMPGKIAAGLDKEPVTATVDGMSTMISLLSLASGLSFVVRDDVAIPPFSIQDAKPSQLMQKAIGQSGGKLCFIARPYGILVTDIENAATIPGATIPSGIPFDASSPAGTRPAISDDVHAALTREPITLSEEKGAVPLSSLLETLSIASEMTFVAERELTLKPYIFVENTAQDILLALTDAMPDELCFSAAHPFGILAGSRNLIKRYSGYAIPEDLSYEPDPAISEVPSIAAFPEEVKQKLSQTPVAYNVLPDALAAVEKPELKKESTGSDGAYFLTLTEAGNDFERVFKDATGLTLEIDADALKTRAETKHAIPFCFMPKGTIFFLLSGIEKATGDELQFTYDGDSRITLTTRKESEAASGKAPDSDSTNASSGVEASLPDGSKVALIGVREKASGVAAFWRPDGTPLDEPLYDHVDDSVAAQGKAYEFVCYLKDMDGLALELISDATIMGWGMGPAKTKENANVDGITVFTTFIKTDADMIDLGMMYALNEWKTLVTNENSGGAASYTGDGYGVMFAEPFEKDGTTNVTVTFVSSMLADHEFRVVSVDRAGVVHPSNSAVNGDVSFTDMANVTVAPNDPLVLRAKDVSGNPFTVNKRGVINQRTVQRTVHFVDMKLEDIQEFRVEVTPLEEIRFENVSLKSGNHTECAARVGTVSEQPASTTPPVADSEEETVTLLNIQTGVTPPRAELRDGPDAPKKWYKPGDAFGHFWLDAIDPVAKTITLVTEARTKEYVLHLGEKGGGSEAATLRACHFGPNDIMDAKQWASLASCPALEVLDFYDLSDEDMQRLSAFPALKTLRIQGKHDGFSREAFAAAARIPNLETLDITGRYTDDCISLLKTSTTLKTLKLRAMIQDAAAITDTSLSYLSQMPSLETLELWTGDFSEKGLAILAAMPRLRTLALPNMKCSNVALACLAKIGTLEELSISAPDLVDQDLATLEQLTSLKKLGISSGVNITEAGVAKIRAQMPSLTEVFLNSKLLPASPVHGAAAEQSAPASAWPAEYEALFALKDGENLKRIAPPFAPERGKGVQTAEGVQVIQIVAEWDNDRISKQNAVHSCAPNALVNLKDTLHSLTGLSPVYFDIPNNLSAIEVPGDWSRRKDAPVEAILAEVSNILRSSLAQDIQFTRKDVEQEVIVATGTYSFTPAGIVPNSNEIQFFSNEFEPNRIGGGYAEFSMAVLADAVEEYIGQRIVDETTPSAEKARGVKVHPLNSMVQARQLALRNGDFSELHSLRDMFLDHVAKQTGLTFTLEKRVVSIWEVTGGPGVAVPEEAPMPASQTVAAPQCKEAPDAVISLGNGVTMTFVSIAAGRFMMGRTDGELDSYESESPQHEVTFAREFFMGQYEVTKRQWETVMGTRPWEGQPVVLDEPDSPAVYVSWDDAQAFAAQLTKSSGMTLRLPTEAEWEYAARAGAVTRFYWGDDTEYAHLNEYAWWQGNALDKGEAYAHIVGLKKPNAWNLYDMSGNVWEWCQDWTHNTYDGAPADGGAWETPVAHRRVIRGGDWGHGAGYCRLANRSDSVQTDRYKGTGFRLVMQEPDNPSTITSAIALPATSTAASVAPAVPNTDTLTPDPASPAPVDEKSELEKALDSPISIEFEDIHLNEILEFMADSYDMNFAVDWRAVAPPVRKNAFGKWPAKSLNQHGKECVTDGIVPYISLKNISIASALRGILTPLRLSFKIEPYAVWISSPALMEADAKLLKPSQNGASEDLAQTFTKPVSIEFEDIRVEELLSFISETWDVNLVLDSRAVAPKKFTLSKLVDDASGYVSNGFIYCVNLRNLPLSEALDLFLRPLNLTFKADNDIVWISSYALIDSQATQVK